MIRIRFHGRGGHGIKTASRIVGTAAFLAGYQVNKHSDGHNTHAGYSQAGADKHGGVPPSPASSRSEEPHV